jgi:2-amino-4-hydroxy-6-hydroxymethyldihydropteridine diphosphokinase
MLQGLTMRKPGQPVLKSMLNPVLLAFGANLPSPFGTPIETIIESIKELEESKLVVRAVSRLFKTPAFPPSSGSDYVNAVAFCESDMPADDILKLLHRIEEKFGRLREHRWDARTLDIDLLAVGDQVAPNLAVHADWRNLGLEAQTTTTPDQLILPHPRIQDRSFVLIPLADVAPDWVHPILGLSVTEMLGRLPADASDGIRPEWMERATKIPK